LRLAGVLTKQIKACPYQWPLIPEFHAIGNLLHWQASE